MMMCWGITFRILDEKKEPYTDIIVLYLLFVDFEFWDGKHKSLYRLLFILKAQI